MGRRGWECKGGGGGGIDQPPGGEVVGRWMCLRVH